MSDGTIAHRSGGAALAAILAIAAAGPGPGPAIAGQGRAFVGLTEVNPPAGPGDGPPTAIVGARLIDGRGGPAVPDSAVVVRGSTIVAAGPRHEVEIPGDALVIDGSGTTVLPGLIDTHFHHDRRDPANRLLAISLARGVTSLRDPGHPIPSYRQVIDSAAPMPRCFLSGRHFDQEPHAHPDDAEAIRSAREAADAVDRRLTEGASAIKVYYRLPIDLIRATCEAAHERGIPVTAHLELVDADRAIEAGLDGVEHVTSFGTALADPGPAERFRRAVDRDNAARHEERYRLWATIDPDTNPRVGPLIALMRERGVVLSPTLAVFERRQGDRDAEEFHVRGFEAMMRFVRRCHEGGVPIVVGSHTRAPHAEEGGAYLRELELLVECGLTPAEAIVAATTIGARFLGCGDRLGSIAPGMTADLILVDGEPDEEIAALRRVSRVMLNGRWLEDVGGAGGNRN